MVVGSWASKPTPAANAVPESFEQGTAGWANYWNASSCAGKSTEQAKTGTNSLKHCFTGAPGGSYYDVSSLTNGERYMISAWLHAGTPTQSKIWLHDISPGTPSPPAYGEASLANQWQCLAAPFTGTASGQVRIHLHTDRGGTDNVYWDDVRLEPAVLYQWGFESGSAGWALDYWGSLTTEAISKEVAYEGTSSLKHVSNGTRGGSYYDTPSGDGAILVEGCTYFISAWLWSSAPEFSQLWVHDVREGTDVATSGDASKPNLWQLVGVSFTATSTRQVRIHLHTETSSGPLTMFWDQVDILYTVLAFVAKPWRRPQCLTTSVFHLLYELYTYSMHSIYSTYSAA